MSAIHIKIVDSNGRRLLEMTQYHDRTKQEMIKFLDEIEQLVTLLAPINRTKALKAEKQ